jgi:hypothetical protein
VRLAHLIQVLGIAVIVTNTTIRCIVGRARARGSGRGRGRGRGSTQW